MINQRTSPVEKVIRIDITIENRSLPPKYKEKGMAAHINKPSIISKMPIILITGLNFRCCIFAFVIGQLSSPERGGK
jgi:hypothetical protein